MAEFIRTEEKVFNVSEPVIFENNTDSDFSVSAAIVFRKSGLYDVSIVGRRIIISKVAERKKGKWMFEEYPDGYYHSHCSECEAQFPEEAYLQRWHFCPNCSSDMREEGGE